MIWKVEFDERARRELRALDPQVQRVVLKYFRKRIATEQDPRRFGRSLRHELAGLWRYRIGDYRAVCQIKDRVVTVLVLRIGHRRRVYR